MITTRDRLSPERKAGLRSALFTEEKGATLLVVRCRDRGSGYRARVAEIEQALWNAWQSSETGLSRCSCEHWRATPLDCSDQEDDPSQLGRKRFQDCLRLLELAEFENGAWKTLSETKGPRREAQAFRGFDWLLVFQRFLDDGLAPLVHIDDTVNVFIAGEREVDHVRSGVQVKFQR